ncbi:MAG: hypothetical protein AAF266_04765 [Planctomycetota bacterium]
MRARRQAFSLLELVLAIGLSIALATLLGFAINLHLVRLDSSRTTIEQAQVARALLDRLAADLGAVTTAPTQEVSDLMTAAKANAKFDVDEIDEPTDITTDGEADSNQASKAMPGLYATIDTLQIDRRRLRLSLVTTEFATTPTARIDAGWDRVRYSLSLTAESPGLVRTETPRDAARWRAEQGEPAAFAEPLAPEVRRVQFRYFDGEQLLEAWDMAEREALPLAVEVVVEFASVDEEGTDAPEARRRPSVYRRFVRLPAASEELPESNTGTAEATDEAIL